CIVFICLLGIGLYACRINHIDTVIVNVMNSNYRVLWEHCVFPQIKDSEKQQLLISAFYTDFGPVADENVSRCVVKHTTKNSYLFKSSEYIMLHLLLSTHDLFLSCMQEHYRDINGYIKNCVDLMYNDYYKDIPERFPSMSKFSPYRTAK
ncbi:MAG: hypothetical protein MJ158_02050, partial [Alphaproteobacteria bacterium]|nr:hypothetical protein [Alphaproteobacteria bacterium]